MDTQSADTGDPGATLDPAVLDAAECLVDTWVENAGWRFYRLSNAIADRPPVYAWVRYTRDIDSETGDPVEQEIIEAAGELNLDPQLSQFDEEILAYLKDGNEYYWNHGTVEMMIEEFEAFFEDRIPELIAGQGNPIADITASTRVRVSMRRETEAGRLADLSENFDTAEWENFLLAVREATRVIDDPAHDSGERPKYTYTFKPVFDPVPEWRLRAIENHLCGVFRNAPALAAVAALLDSGVTTTQAEMAEVLGKDRSTVTQQIADVEDWRSRCRWMCDSRDL